MIDSSGSLNGIRQSGGAGDSRGYRAAQEVERIAAVTCPSHPKQTLNAIDQLANALNSGAPLRRDVPRGFYLNIVT
jgi:hypothetical protein